MVLRKKFFVVKKIIQKILRERERESAWEIKKRRKLGLARVQGTRPQGAT